VENLQHETRNPRRKWKKRRWRRRTGQETTKTRLKRRERTNDEGNLTAEPLIVLLLGGSSLVHGGVMTRSITWYQGGLPSASEWLVLYPRTTLVSVLWSLQYESSPDGGYLICSSLRATLDWFAVLKLNPMHFFPELFPSGYRFLLRGGTLSRTRTLEDTSTYDDKNKTHCSTWRIPTRPYTIFTKSYCQGVLQLTSTVYFLTLYETGFQSAMPPLILVRTLP